MSFKKNIKLSAYLAKKRYNSITLDSFIEADKKTVSYELIDDLGLEGVLFVKENKEKKPAWTPFLESLVKNNITEIINRSSSATLILRKDDLTMAFVFGYGRSLIKMEYFEQDFGIKTALNTIDHDSLRSVDLVTFDEQTVQKRTQSIRDSGLDIFGIDIFKDILRSVTGCPKNTVKFTNICGGDSCFTFQTKLEKSADLLDVLSKLGEYYNDGSYKDNFSWVDNIKKVKNLAKIDELNSFLVDAFKNNSSSIAITMPENIKWDKVLGFSFTRTKRNIVPIVGIDPYIEGVSDKTSVDIKLFKKDFLFVHDVDGNCERYHVYECMYFEHYDNALEKIYILFYGTWYEIEKNFLARINNSIKNIELSEVDFPSVYIWEETDKSGKIKLRIETEGDYNLRAAGELSINHLDKKLVKSSRATTSIELCDLLTDDKKFIHVKHKKGGSAGLSHLFAQGNIAAELLLGDRDFREASRKILREVKAELDNIVPLDEFDSKDVEIVFLILGDNSSDIKNSLPFFSKVNLSKTFENLSQRNFTVKIAGVGTKKIEAPTK